MADSQSQTDPAFDVTAQQIARRYAQGLLEAAGPEAEAAVADLEAIDAEVFQKHPRLLETLCSAFLDHAQREGIVDRVFGGKVAGVVTRLLKVLSAHDRMDLARAVVSQARLLLNESQNRVEVVVRLASRVEQATLDQIAQTVREKIRVEPIIRVEIDPALVGGLEVRVGDTVFDGSLRTAFKRAHKAIVEQTVQAIETQPERFTLAG